MNDMTPIDIAHPQDGMRDLATRIEAEHAAVAQALQSALAHAIAAGELLIVAKRHGRGLREDLKARLRPGQPNPRCRYCPGSH